MQWSLSTRVFSKPQEVRHKRGAEHCGKRGAGDVSNLESVFQFYQSFPRTPSITYHAAMTDVLYIGDTVFEELSASNTDFKPTRGQKFCLVQGGHRIQYSKSGSVFRTRLHVCVAKTRRTMFFSGLRRNPRSRHKINRKALGGRVLIYSELIFLRIKTNIDHIENRWEPYAPLVFRCSEFLHSKYLVPRYGLLFRARRMPMIARHRLSTPIAIRISIDRNT